MSLLQYLDGYPEDINRHFEMVARHYYGEPQTTATIATATIDNFGRMPFKYCGT